MEFQLGKIYDNFPEQEIKVEFCEILSKEEFLKFERSISKIEELNNIRRLLGFVIKNDSEILDFLNTTSQDFIEKSVSWNGVSKTDLDRLFSNVNRLFLNYLSSIKTFIDHIETHINRKFGEKSKEFIDFKKVLSLFYDNSFAYRFFYELRNYSQHCGLPIDNVKYTTEYDRENNRIKGVLQVKFNRIKLLSNYKKWKKVKIDLIGCDEEFNVTPLIWEMTNNIKEIERNVEIIHKDSLLDSINFITNRIKHLRKGPGEVFIAYDFKDKVNGELSNYSTIDIPFDTIDFINQVRIED